MSAWSCAVCPDHGEGTPTEVDKAAAKHVKATSHSTMTSTHSHLRSGWCTAPTGMRPKHEGCHVPCSCTCHEEAIA